MMKLPEGRFPVIPLMGAPGISLTHLSLKDNLTRPDVQAATLLALQEKFEPDGIFVFMDLTVEAECLGLPIVFPKNDPPSVRNHPVKDAAGLARVESRWHGIGGRMPVFLKTMEEIARENSTVNGGYVVGPLTLAGELLGVTDLALASILHEDFVLRVLDFTTGVTLEYGRAFLNAGADVIAVLEPSAVLFSPEQFRKLCAAYFRKLQESLKTRLILHVCGNTTPLLGEMSETEALGLSLDSTVDFGAAARVIPEHIGLIGNISPVNSFLNGDERKIESDVESLVSQMRGRSNFILSSGCDLPAAVPLDNIARFIETGKKVGSI